jgi:hypothetical protein
MSVQVPFRGFILDQSTIDAVLLMERLLGYPVRIMQGSWSNVSASAGTHSAGGAVDVSIEDANGNLLPLAQQIDIVHAGRAAGFAMERRTPAEGFVYHAHGILRGDLLVSLSAAEQLVQWDAGLNGLADHGPDDDPVDVAAGRPPVYPRGAPVALVLDIAWDRPTTAQIKATGAVGVVRYFSPDATKNITAAEVTDYIANGISVGTVYESTAGRATAGQAAGAADAHLAEEQRVKVGLPNTHRHHFAVDSDVPWSSVQAYFAGAASVVGLVRVGTYGSFRVIEGAYGYGIRKLWQTLAWSGGQVSSHATLYQSGGTLLGGQADINRTLATDWGQTPRPGAVDMPLTQTDADLVANTLLAKLNNTTIATAVVGKMESGKTGTAFDRDLLAGPAFWWLRLLADPTLPLPTGPDLPPIVSYVAEIRAALAGDTAVVLTPAQVQAIADQVGAALGAQVADVLAARLAT